MLGWFVGDPQSMYSVVELGSLLRATSSFGFKLAVGGTVAAVNQAATDLQATPRGMSNLARETTKRSTNVTMAAAEELGASVNEIGRRVSESATLAQAAVVNADRTSALVRDLSASATEIRKIVAMISDMVSQTNLLALNATIEAARAGERSG